MVYPLEDLKKSTVATKSIVSVLIYICSHADVYIMRIKIIVPIFFLAAITLLSFESYGQEPADLRKSEQARVDSIRKVDRDLKKQASDDKDRMNDAKDASKELKEKAKESKRIQRDASDASDQAKKSLKDEKRAQRLRKKANQQAKRATEARDKSDRNN